MLVNAAGEAVGSVSGGCIEGAVYEMAGEVIADGVPQFEKYGISNDDAFAVGLTCGGILEACKITSHVPLVRTEVSLESSKAIKYFVSEINLLI